MVAKPMSPAQKQKKQDKEKKDLQDALEMFEKIEKETKYSDVKDYIAKEVRNNQITKGFITAYVKKYGTEEDKVWFKEEFKINTKITRPRTEQSVKLDANGNPILGYSKKGKVYARKEAVIIDENDTVEQFSITTARKLFKEHFKIETKKAEVVPDYDVFDEI